MSTTLSLPKTLSDLVRYYSFKKQKTFKNVWRDSAFGSWVEAKRQEGKQIHFYGNAVSTKLYVVYFGDDQDAVEYKLMWAGT